MKLSECSQYLKTIQLNAYQSQLIDVIDNDPDDRNRFIFYGDHSRGKTFGAVYYALMKSILNHLS